MGYANVMWLNPGGPILEQVTLRRTFILSQKDTFASSFEGMKDLAARLRGPDGCPWDREQTSNSLKHLFLEECYELVEAIEEGDDGKIVEELGDVLFHAVSMVQIAERVGRVFG